MKEKILTAYGPMELEIRRIVGSRIYVTRERHVFPAGTKTRGGEVLKEDFVVPRGAVLVPRWTNSRDKPPEQFHQIFPDGIYEALRGTVHAIWGYGLGGRRGETQILRDISNRLTEDLAVLMEGKNAPSRQLYQVQKDLAKIAVELDRTINPEKSEAAEKVEAAATLEVLHPSGTRSKNIPATARRVHAAKIRVDRRRAEIRRIGPRVEFHEMILAQAIGHLFDELQTLRNILRSEQFQIAQGLSPAVKRIFEQRADFALRDLLPQLDAEPFRRTAEMIRVDLAKAKAAKSKKFALAAIDRILAAIRLKEAQRAFEQRIILPLAVHEGMGVGTEADFQHTKLRLMDFILRLHREINDNDFVRPVKTRAVEAISALHTEEFGDERDAARLKERLKAVSRMF